VLQPCRGAAPPLSQRASGGHARARAPCGHRHAPQGRCRSVKLRAIRGVARAPQVPGVQGGAGGPGQQAPGPLAAADHLPVAGAHRWRGHQVRPSLAPGERSCARGGKCAAVVWLAAAARHARARRRGWATHICPAWSLAWPAWPASVRGAAPGAQAGARRAGLTRPRCARACARTRATRTCRTWTARSSCRTCATWRRCTSSTPLSARPGARSRSAGRAPRMPLPGAVGP